MIKARGSASWYIFIVLDSRFLTDHYQYVRLASGVAGTFTGKMDDTSALSLLFHFRFIFSTNDVKEEKSGRCQLETWECCEFCSHFHRAEEIKLWRIIKSYILCSLNEIQPIMILSHLVIAQHFVQVEKKSKEHSDPSSISPSTALCLKHFYYIITFHSVEKKKLCQAVKPDVKLHQGGKVCQKTSNQEFLCRIWNSGAKTNLFFF